MSVEKFDVLIIGNGAIGCALALSLTYKNPDASIAILGKDNRSGSASLAAGMMLNLFAELEDNSLSSPFYRKKFEMGLKAKSAWNSWIEQINEQAGMELVIKEGTYVLSNTANTYASDDKNFKYIQQILTEYQTDYEVGEPDGLKGYYPEERYRSKQVLYIPSEGFIETAKLFQAYDQILQTSPNITVVNELAEHIFVDDNGLKKIRTDSRELLAEKVVICAGAFSQSLIQQLPIPEKQIPHIFYGCGTGLHVKVHKERQERIFDLPDKVIRTLTRGQSCGVNIVPYDDFRCYVGASNFNLVYEERSSQLHSIYAILRDLMNEFNRKFAGAFFDTIVGQRPLSMDGYPLIGKTSVQDVWIVTGTKREGFFLSPFIAESITNELLGKSSLTPDCFLPERSLIYDLTREEGIQKAVTQHLSFLFYFDLNLPKLGDDYLLAMAAHYRAKIEKIYDELGFIEHGVTPGLIDIHQKQIVGQSSISSMF